MVLPILSGDKYTKKVEKVEKVEKSVPNPVHEENEGADVKIRRNALQLRKAVEQEEKELLEKEKIWETPAIFRRGK